MNGQQSRRVKRKDRWIGKGAAEFKLRKWLRDPVGAFNCD
jgi:hypothetical protein